MTTRRRAREIVLQVLFEEDQNPMRDAARSDEFLQRRLLNNKPLIAFARELWKGVQQNRRQLDERITQNAANWSIKRMAAIDRNILRLATFEMTLYNVPGRVAINEAVDLAKRYGNRNSGQFVNGVLDRVLKAFERGTIADSSELQPVNSEVLESTVVPTVSQ